MKSVLLILVLYIIITFTSAKTKIDEEKKELRYTFGGTFMVLGGLYLLLGYRLFRFTLILTGFLVFFFMMYMIIRNLTSIDLAWVLIIAGVAGFSFAILIWKLWILGLFLSGFFLSFIICCLIFTTPLGPSILDGEAYIPLVVVLGCSVVVGFLNLFSGLQKTLTIASTAVGGAYAIAMGLDLVFFSSNFYHVLPDLFLIEKLVIDKTNPVPYALLVGVVLVSIASFIIQWFLIAKEWNHKQKSFETIE
eukprot:TRINITY_DN11557_c0_g1_i1.p1 TRINITY_DN11557_c0_g1~~TRINITY_DN11557_c0_g1_i1.p1  ORF type:complete len:249 (+),score=23.83 TRINITY_DN11557_c0_g1_i1:69-815(+)